jgi:hypothetical protein
LGKRDLMDAEVTKPWRKRQVWPLGSRKGSSSHSSWLRCHHWEAFSLDPSGYGPNWHPVVARYTDFLELSQADFQIFKRPLIFSSNIDESDTPNPIDHSASASLPALVSHEDLPIYCVDRIGNFSCPCGRYHFMAVQEHLLCSD